ncbi:MAG: adenylosuccinate lyase [Gammaproteobacteria bacterium]
MLKNTLNSISPLDGRYATKLRDLEQHFSEFALIKNRVLVEINWLIFMSRTKSLRFIPALSKNKETSLLKIINEFSVKDAEQIKKIEAKTNHDVKAVEVFIGKKLESLNLKKYKEFVHLFCTSEDINNLSYNLMLKGYIDNEFKEINSLLLKDLKSKSKKWSKLSMLSFTHGQTASPTTLGKEIANFHERIKYHLNLLKSLNPSGKFNGAVGNYNAHVITDDKVNWQSLSEKFVKSLGLNWSKYSTQIELKDEMVTIISTMENLNNVLLDLSKDCWLYISKGYLKQLIVAGEVGSSTMPHKVNPIDFENAEGNLTISNSISSAIREKIQISRLQRDLSDSTTLRNLGSAFGYSYLAYKSLLKGFSKIEANKKQIKEDLENSWEVLAEPLQTIMRKNKIANSYDLIKKISRGKPFDKKIYLDIIATLDIDEKDKAKLSQLTPLKYTGLAEKLAKEI